MCVTVVDYELALQIGASSISLLQYKVFQKKSQVFIVEIPIFFIASPTT
jgi:hypothetical protein